MEVDKIHRYFRWLIYIFELYFLYSLQQAPALSVGFFGIRPILLVPAFVSIALFEKEFTGMAFGIVAGMFLDFSFGNPLGIYALFLCILGYVLGVLSTYFFRSNFWTALAATAVITSATVMLRFYFNYILSGFKNESFALINFCIPVIIYSIILAPTVFLFNRSVSYFVRGGGEQNQIKFY